MERTELKLLAEQGFRFSDPYDAVVEFEKRIAQHYGAKYGVAVDCCTHAIELSLRYLKAQGSILIPKRTYLSIPMTVMKLGCQLQWEDNPWEKVYELKPYPVVDASLSFEPNSYQPGTFMCLSFQQKKSLPIGRGGMILTNDLAAAEWLKKSSYDGRNRGQAWKQDKIEMLGYHYYMTPEDAARGILLFEKIKNQKFSAGGHKDYPDISTFEVFQKELS